MSSLAKRTDAFLTAFLGAASLGPLSERGSDGGPPEVRVNALPYKVTRGNLLQIQAIFLDRLTGDPIRVNEIFLQIRDQAGVVVYPTSVVARHQSGMVIDIGTLEFPPGPYNIMVSNRQSLSPSDTATFTVTGPDLPEPSPTLKPIAEAKPTDLPEDQDLKKRLDPFQSNVPIVPLLPADRRSALIISRVRFVTELDRKVCVICRVYEGAVYELDDVRKPDIPLHPNCRCHYEYVDTPPSSRKITAEEAEARARAFRSQ